MDGWMDGWMEGYPCLWNPSQLSISSYSYSRSDGAREWSSYNVVVDLLYVNETGVTTAAVCCVVVNSNILRIRILESYSFVIDSSWD